MAFEIIIKPNIFTEKVFVADENSITYHDLKMECADITGFRYGITSQRLNGIETRVEYKMEYIDSSADEISILFSDGMFQINEAKQKFDALVKITWDYVGNRLLNAFLADITNGKEIVMGKMTFNRDGVHFLHKPFFGKERQLTIAWNHIRHDVTQGTLNFKSAIDSDINRSLSVSHNYNMMILHNVFNLARTNREVLESLMGKKLNTTNRR